MAYFLTKNQEYSNIVFTETNIFKKIHEKINGSAGWNKNSGSTINQNPSSTMSVMLCTGATFVKKNFCLVARIVSFDTVHLLTFRVLEPYPFKDSLTLHVFFRKNIFQGWLNVS